jgi:hypothetical protein
MNRSCRYLVPARPFSRFHSFCLSSPTPLTATASLHLCTRQDPGVLVDDAVVDIRPWIANGRFEGNQKLKNTDGVLAGDNIQLAVKISYKEAAKTPAKPAKPVAAAVATAAAAAAAPGSPARAPGAGSNGAAGADAGAGHANGARGGAGEAAAASGEEGEKKDGLFRAADDADRIFAQLIDKEADDASPTQVTNHAVFCPECKVVVINSL